MYKKIINAFFLVISASLVIGLIYYAGFNKAWAAPDTAVYFEPALKNITTGQSFSLDVMINPGKNQVYGIDAHITYDSQKVQMTQIVKGDEIFGVELANTIDNNTGQALISLLTEFSGNPAFINKLTKVATLTFNAIGEGNINITLTDGKTIAIARNENADVISIKSPAAVNVSAKAYSDSDFALLVDDWQKINIDSQADVDGDRIVDSRDLGIMMSYWTNE